jgi:hypothetical protein
MDAAAKSILKSKYHTDTGKRAEENAEIIRKSKPLVSNLNEKPATSLIPENNGSGNSLNDSSVNNAEIKKLMRENDTSVNINAPTTIINKQTPQQSISRPTSADRPAIAGIK